MKGFLFKIMGMAALFVGGVIPSFAAKEVNDTLTAGEVFVNLPVNTLDILSRSIRYDMLDYYDIDSLYQAKNGMEGISVLDSVAPDYLKVKLTPVSTMEIGMLQPKKKNDPVAVVLYTVGGDSHAKDTDVTFFNSEYKELTREKYLEYPDVYDFFDTSDKNVRELIDDLIPFPTMEFNLDPGPRRLTCVLTVGEFMGKENFDKIKEYLKPEISFLWDGKRYKLIK